MWAFSSGFLPLIIPLACFLNVVSTGGCLPGTDLLLPTGGGRNSSLVGALQDCTFLLGGHGVDPPSETCSLLSGSVAV